jgi:hypothetical protein
MPVYKTPYPRWSDESIWRFVKSIDNTRSVQSPKHQYDRIMAIVKKWNFNAPDEIRCDEAAQKITGYKPRI